MSLLRTENRNVRTSTFYRILASLVAVAAVFVGSAVIVPAANAAVLTGAITSVEVEQDTMSVWEHPKVNILWSVPTTGTAGDTFTLTLPPELQSYGGGFDLKAPDGSVVATATLSNDVYTFTLTDYATTHDTISGTATFEASFESSVQPDSTVNLDFATSGPTFSDSVVIKAVTPSDHPTAVKFGFFTDNADQGVTNPIRALSWRIQSPAGPWSTAVFTDTVGASQTMDCTNIRVQHVTGYDATGYPNVTAPLSASEYTIDECTLTGFKITVNKDVVAPNLVRVLYTTSLTDGSAADSYDNSGSVSVDGGEAREVHATAEKSNQGGNGSGQQGVSVGDFVWVDTNRDGRQDAGEPGIEGVTLTLTGPDGNPVTDVTGKPVGPATTDANGAYTFGNLPLLPVGQSYTVTVDQTSPALAPYVPTLPGIGDRAGDSSTGSASSGDLNVNRSSDTTLDFGYVKPMVSVGDFVWVDTNRNGIQDAGEPGIEGVTLTITGPDGNPVTDVDGKPVGSATTDANGLYSFDKLPALAADESYTVKIDSSSPALAPYVPTTPGAGGDTAVDSSTGSETSGDLTKNGDRDSTLDFGFVTPPAVSVGDFVWVDSNRNGIQDAGEPGIAGVTLTLTGPDGQPVTDLDGNPVGPATTDADGKYSFDNLPALAADESYTVTIDQKSPALAHYIPTMPGVGNDGSIDSSAGSAKSGDLTADGDRDPTLDFGFVTPPSVSVGDLVWVDTNGNGRQDTGEPGIEGVTLTVTGPDGKPVTDVDGNPVGPVRTDADGKYTFEKLPVLPAGESYTVTIDTDSPALAPYVPTTPGVGDNAGDSSTGSATSGDLVAEGDRDDTLDFGFVKPSVSVGDYVWADTNRDGIQDAGEPGIEGVTLTLTGPDGKPVTDIFGNPVAPAKTDGKGAYSFDHLPVLAPGESYTVTIDQASPALAKFVPTTPGAGDAATDSSTGSVASGDLTADGARDSTLDFGFIVATPAIDIEKWSTKDGAVDGDYDTAPGKELKAGEKESVTFTVTNSGNEALIDVVVSDATDAGPELENVSCDFSALGGPSAGLEWDGPFAPGASFECTGELPGLETAVKHADTASVTGVGAGSGISVSDKDAWNAETPEVVLATPIDEEGLAMTGASWQLLGLASALAFVCGILLLLGARRKRRI